MKKKPANSIKPTSGHRLAPQSIRKRHEQERAKQRPAQSAGVNDADIDAVIASVRDQPVAGLALSGLPNLEASKAFRVIVRAYLEGGIPPFLIDQRGWVGLQAAGTAQQRASRYTDGLVCALGTLKERVDSGILAEDYRRAKQEFAKWQEKKRTLCNYLDMAADLFDDGQFPSALPVITNPDGSTVDMEAVWLSLSLKGCVSGSQRLDEVLWCGSNNLRRWSDNVRRTPIEAVFPLAAESQFLAALDIKNLGGAKANGNAAIRAAVVRGIEPHIPEAILTKRGSYGRPAAVKGLAAAIGIQLSDQAVGEQVNKLQLERDRNRKLAVIG